MESQEKTNANSNRLNLNSNNSRVLKILLVEDNKINQKIGLGVLKPFNHNVIIAENGQEAVDKFESFMPDLILMDIQMPVMDGFTATKKIREIEVAKDLRKSKIVALTANALQEEKRKCFDSGMDDFVAKPFKISDMEKVLSEILY
jgi:CheY-like chemotaxis protein